MPQPSWRGRARPSGWQLAVPVVFTLAGALFVTSSLSAAGTDLRPATTDLSTLVGEQTDSVDSMRQQVRELRADVTDLTATVDNVDVRAARARVEELRPGAGMTPVEGSGLAVTLDDAPDDLVPPEGLNPNRLVVHQQDIQAFVNALWAGGATAISLQGQRLVSSTGVKCVGNTVVLEGVPYSPPYRIEAVGNVPALEAALDGSSAVANYRIDAAALQLGLSVDQGDGLEIPGYDGSEGLDIAYAQPFG